MRQEDLVVKKKRIWTGINQKIVIIFLVVINGLIVLTFLINFFLLKDYYARNKVGNLEKVYGIFEDQSRDGHIYSPDYRLQFEQICANFNLDAVVTSGSGDLLLSSMDESSAIPGSLRKVLAENRDLPVPSTSDENPSSRQIRVADSHTHEEYLVLIGRFTDGNSIVIRSGVESLKEAAFILRKTLFIAGTISVILSVLVGGLAARMITERIRRMQKLARRMSDLDFDAKYQRTTNYDELDDLGESLNELSGKLQTSIGELKTANNDLKKGLEIRDKQEKMRREFLSNASHELKTPIAVIQGYAEGLQDGIAQTPEDIQFYTETILDEANRMNRLVRQMINLNTLEYGKNMVSMERFDLMASVRSLVASQKILASGMRIDIEPENEPIHIWADPTMTEQVISNYLSNAIHYCGGRKEIRLRAKREPKRVRFSVFNTGDPIPEAALDHLFEKFYKVDKARSRAYGGSGIGLSVVKAISESFQQECGVINHKDGVEFYFTFDTTNA